MIDASYCVWHKNAHTYMPIKHMSYMYKLVCILVSGTYMATTCEVNVAAAVFWHIYAHMSYLYDHTE